MKLEEGITKLQKPLQGIFWPALLGLGFILLIGSKQVAQKDTLLHFDRSVFPVQAANWLEEHPQTGQMFNEFNWGGYLLYRLWPEQRVFLDSQTDFYGEALVREYEQAITASAGWENVLSHYNVSWVILPQEARLIGTLQDRADWEMIYKDETAIIMRKSP